jgi:hypothetical protein
MALHQLRHASGCLGMSCRSSLTTSPTPRVQVPRHVARLVTRLVVDYFDYAVCPGASARRAACRVARRRLLCLRRVSGCLGTSRDLSRGSSSTTSSTSCVPVPRHVARLVVDFFAYAAHPGASASRAACRVACRRLLRLHHASGCLGTSCGSSLTSSPTPHVRMPRHVARLVTRFVASLVVDYFAYAMLLGASARHAARCRLLRLRHASGCLGTSRGLLRGSSSTTSSTPRVWVPRHVARLVAWLVVDYFVYTARLRASARRAARCRLLRLRRASGCLGTSRALSCGSSSTTSSTPRVRVPRHVVRLVVDFFAYAARLDASARRAARHAARRVARCRLLRLRRASECLGTSRGLLSTSSLTPRVRVHRLLARLIAPLVVDYFNYAARPGVSARRAARHAARRTARRRLFRLTQACRRLLCLRHASGCLGTSRGLLRCSSSTTSTTPRIRVPGHVARLVAPLVVDYFDYAARPSASARCAARHAARRATCRRLLRLTQAHRRLLRLRRASRCFGTSCRSSSTTSTMPRVQVSRHVARLVTRLVVPLVIDYSASRRLVDDYLAYTARLGASARRVARRQLLRLRRASGCLGTSRGTSRGSSRRSSSTIWPTPRVRVPRDVAQLITPLVVDYSASRRLVVGYLDYTAHPGASARHATRRVAHRRLPHLAQARTSHVRVSRHVTRLVTRLVIDYFDYAACPGASARRAARHAARRAARRRLLRLAQARVDYLAYTACPGASARRAT